MPYDSKLADKIRTYLAQFPKVKVEEKKMFSGLTFMVNGKMCVGVSGEKLMCRFDPALQQQIAEKEGYKPMIMKAREYKGYCYVDPSALTSAKALQSWVDLCLEFNGKAKASGKKKS